MNESVRILLVEDLPNDAELAQREIRKTLQSCVFRRVETQPDYLAAIEEFQPDLIISDYWMPQFDGLTALKLALERTPFTPVIILTGAINEDTAVECMKAGAADYVIKEHLKRLGQAVIHVLEQKKLRQERYRAEEALRESEERYRTLAETANDVIFIIGADDTYQYINQFGARLLGLQPQDMIGQKRSDFFPPSITDYQAVTMQRVLESGEPGYDESPIPTPTGERWLSTSLVPLKDQAGKVNAVLGISRDISERRRAEAAQAELEQQLRQAQKLESIGQLAGGIAHDFNNLLVPIIGYAELGQIGLPPDSRLYADLEKIRRAAERAASLTKQILAFSRRQVLEIRAFNLNEVIAEFQEMLRRLIGENIELQIALAETPCPVKADKAQIEQVLMNLSVNARDAMPNGGKLIIETDNVFLDETFVQKHSETLPGQYVILSLSDTGHGMDSEVQKHIFEPFFTTKTQGKGTGLGLATVFGIVKQHQGNIWVYSEPGKGTTFRIYLPRSEETTQFTGITSPDPTSVYGVETVLVVEDEPMVRKLACETLEMYGYTVIEAESPANGLQIASTYEGTLHLLLTDVIMPAMSGPDLYEKLAIIRPGLKVLYMSGYTDNVIVHHNVLGKGANLLQKPFTVRGLTQKVRKVLDRKTP